MARRRSANEAVAQTVGTTQATRSQVDWSSRTRTRQVDVKVHTRFVSIMKRTLLLLGVALVGAVIAYSLQQRTPGKDRMAITFRQLGILNNDLTMFKPKLTGDDSDGNPYVVTADQAVQDAHNTNRALLKNVEADLTLKDGSWLNATAPRGMLDVTHAHGQQCAKSSCPASQTLDMMGPIAVFSDNGYEVHTTYAHIDMGNGIVHGNKYVRGQGPIGIFNADSFVFKFHPHQPGAHSSHPAKGAKKTAELEKQIFLYGNVHMIFYGRGFKSK
jgi:lipopolysaccharide export system protein LptC